MKVSIYNRYGVIQNEKDLAYKIQEITQTESEDDSSINNNDNSEFKKKYSYIETEEFQIKDNGLYTKLAKTKHFDDKNYQLYIMSVMNIESNDKKNIVL